MKHLVPVAIALLLGGCATSGLAPPSASPAATDGLAADLLVARYAEMSRDPAGAAARFRQALTLNPGDPALIEGALRASLMSGDWEGGLAAARQAQAQGAIVGWTSIALAAEDLRRGRYGAARVRTHAADAGPYELLLTRTLAVWTDVGERRVDVALRSLGVGGPAAASRLGEIQAAMVLDQAGRSEEALAAYARAQRGARIALLAELQGRLLERMGRKTEAVALYEGVLREADQPAIARALERLRAGQAPPAFDKPAQGAAASVFILASALLSAEDLDLLLPSLTLALALDPDLDPARMALGEGMEELGQPEPALALLDQVPPASPYRDVALARSAWILERAGRADEALARAERAAQGGGQGGALVLADLLRERKRWAEAEAIYTHILDGFTTPEPRHWRLYFARGAVRERKGAWPEAEADLKRALELSPEQPDVLNYLGYSWIDQGVRLAEGMAMIVRAAEARPDAGHIIDSLGWAHFRLGQYDEALTHLERAAILEPNDPTVNDHLGDVYWRLGRRVEAGFQWRRALAMDPEPDARAAIEAKIATGLPPAAATAQAKASEPKK